MIDLERDEGLCAAATAKPWRQHDEEYCPLEVWGALDDPSGSGVQVCMAVNDRDAVFIVRARQLLPEYIAEVRRLRALVLTAFEQGFYAAKEQHYTGPIEAWSRSETRKALEQP